ncbi:hypothetical protein A3D84_04595 [Candidatus Woesebacteria bacterium RIFCSPHIGHO2_02_FULL_42_20]|uniref:Thioredoxin domain-containing protein n=1 Tax=Candidatus Woesebacteria bacterium RIFCSPHIGHO2_12_FULL_41_24 TaxID=1802510 RepID=A0A1F8ARH3_9BACT|nr:MAG: hypothetical protein A2W15_06300 [Candidatus Woesebacteria bacterium RBG_16_41_13]OGM28675.1 MAG: hypothetical protein A2873_05665 [Candidatus Woesebacteria bacterium RIFCSPHIGHO2_01_FULL_42_80]OGM34461.1 MAG: hypothetical protein A3D84_04595 [Candidatus Woesebacteria bacterium RIFCSPHIGHO2_02_FULL_42_20]OGM54099.1 MAG: hypothetical protein A3E44_02750 [Candidatus Woesebacteria bacterium RIFCSPHIGHO2_12_FULL_41_24]OGM66268.1 MAG: hypothetical protein A2969_01620 [Candidatus Woesebacteri
MLKKENKSLSGIASMFSPVLVLVSIGLAFAAGVLWQKVQYLEKGGTSTSGSAVNVANPSGTAQAPAAAPSKLDNLPALAQTAGVDVAAFNSCFSGSKYADRVESDYQGGVAVGVSGTPGSFVVNAKGEVWNIPGAFPYDSVKIAIDIALGKSGTLPQGITKLDAATVAKLPKLSNNDHVRGSRNAAIKLIEYSDFQCPFCQRFHPTVRQAVSDYGDKIALVYRHFPLDSLHPRARPAALASECIAELGGDEAFWKFVDEVFKV